MLLNGSRTGVIGSQSQIHLTVPSIQLNLKIADATLDVLCGAIGINSETVRRSRQELAQTHRTTWGDCLRSEF